MHLARGFTLIEILVAIGILGIFLPILTLSIQQASASSRITTGRSEVQFVRRQIIAQLERDIGQAGNRYQGQATPVQTCQGAECLTQIVVENMVWYGIETLASQAGKMECQTIWYGFSPGASQLYRETLACGQGLPQAAGLTSWQRGVLAFELSPVCGQRCAIRYGFFLASQAQNLPPPPDRTSYRPGQGQPCVQAQVSLADLTCSPGHACSCQSGLVLIGGNL